MNKAFEKILERLEENKSIIPVNRVLDDIIKDKPKELGQLIAYDNSIKIVQKVAEEYKDGWIPIKTRPMTEEEKEYYSEYLSEGNGMIYDCPLPDDGQEVLITSKYGSVDKTTFYTDCGYYFENYEDYDEVIAWQPLPEPYKERE